MADLAVYLETTRQDGSSAKDATGVALSPVKSPCSMCQRVHSLLGRTMRTSAQSLLLSPGHYDSSQACWARHTEELSDPDRPGYTHRAVEDSSRVGRVRVVDVGARAAPCGLGDIRQVTQPQPSPPLLYNVGSAPPHGHFEDTVWVS